MTPQLKRLAILLALSVALNLICAGFLIGRRLGVRRPDARDSGSFVAEARGRGHHAKLGRKLEAKRGELRTRREAAKRALVEVKRVLEKEPFDRTELERALAKLRADTGKSQELVHQALVDVAVSATPTERSELARAFEDRPRRKR